MTTQSFLIGTIGDGLRKDLKAWATPEDSFDTLTNAYQFRGRIVKRKGYMKLGRLTNGTPVMGLRTYENFGIGLQTLVAFDTTLSYEWNGSAFVTLPSIMPTTWHGSDSNFFWTINYANAFWATNFSNNISGNSGLNGWPLSNVTVNAFTGQAGTGTSATVNVNALGNTAAIGDFVYLLNVTGTAAANNLIFARVTAINVGGNPNVITIEAISFPPGVNAFVNGTAASGILFDSMQAVTGQDGIRYYGILQNGTGWANYNPPIDPNNALAGALLIFAYRGYLVFLNTWEGNEAGVFNFPNRARWTQIGTPYYSAPVPAFPNPQGIDPLAARDDLFGRGGANDAPTDEAIVSAGFIRDILIVYFERSTWRLRFVNNSQNPFVWERVNVELGSSCTFSNIIFDKGLMTISNRGIAISDGNDTIRFDEKIPDEIFKIRQVNEGLQRVYGIRTFETKLNYWTYPSDLNPDGIFPDKVLVFNYDTKNWSFFDDTFTCFGYYYATNNIGQTWNDLTQAWSSTAETWDGGQSEQGYETIVAGNQQGYVLVLEYSDGENDPSLSISAITAGTPGVITSVNNNLPDGTWISLSTITGITSDDGVSLSGRNFKISKTLATDNTFTLNEFEPIIAPNASGTAYQFTVNWKGILTGSCQINIGALFFRDLESNGILTEAAGLGSGTINYSTGLINLVFNPSISSTPVYIRVVTLDPMQGLIPVATIGSYDPGGEIIKISGIDIQTKIFNFFKDNQRARLGRIDFYVDSTATGQFTVDIMADSSNVPINTPLKDNLFQNVVLTSPNPYQVGNGDETIFRLYADAQAQTLQIRLYYSDQQMAVSNITNPDIELLAMMVNMRRAGRLP